MRRVTTGGWCSALLPLHELEVYVEPLLLKVVVLEQVLSCAGVEFEDLAPVEDAIFGPEDADREDAGRGERDVGTATSR